MNYLRLAERNQQNEFYKNDLEATFLADVKDINIVVGANNSRKSRFLRNIISIDFKLIFETSEDLNKAFHDSKHLFDPVALQSGELLSEQLAYLIFPEGSGDTNYKDIKQYVSDNGGNIQQVTFEKLKNSLDNINETLLAFGSIDPFRAWQVIINQVYQTVLVLEGIYEDADREGGKFFEKHVSNTVVAGINYTIQGLEHNHINQFELKLSIIKRIKEYLLVLKYLRFNEFNKELIYIPVLRTARMMSGVGDDVFEKTIQEQHFPKPPNKLKIETGFKLHENILYARNNDIRSLREFAVFEKFIGQTFFQSENISIVPQYNPQNTNNRNIKVSLPGELDNVPMYNLGDGVQGIINLLFPVFTAEEGAWIFIDEPENHLHPGYQNVFIKTIAENEFIKSKKLKFFINTHSNHILSESLLGSKDVEIFVFNRRDENSSNIQTFSGNEYFTLEILGVLNTSVLISNCSIWVEGITDRLYLKAFLFAYCNSLKGDRFKPSEGLHYSYIEYAGKNLTHYNFDGAEITTDDLEPEFIEAYFINSHVFLLADSDFDPERGAKYRKIERNNFRFYETQLPEIENLLPDNILRNYLLNELHSDAQEVAACFPIELHDVKLGRYFQGKISYQGRARKLEAKDGGGTLRYSYKKGLADYVYKQVMNDTYTWDDLQLSDNLKVIVTELYEFIKSKNK
jgi:AAA15 family ATPase/GTPase